MPTISKFYGVKILLYFQDTDRHHLPHIHAVCQSQRAVIGIKDGRVLNGKLPPAKLRMVQTWVDLRRKELLADWKLAVSEKNPLPVKPLE